MAKLRTSIPKQTREAVLREFNHRCALCGADRPHLHHIDQNPSNSDAANLIPLCATCHLTDQHDASNAVPEGKLRFFRVHKHRLILRPQFNSVWRRMEFLWSVSDAESGRALEERAEELASLVSHLSMGPFFAERVMRLLRAPSTGRMLVVGDPVSEARYDAEVREDERNYRDQLRRARPEVEALIVELLDHQTWTPAHAKPVRVKHSD